MSVDILVFLYSVLVCECEHVAQLFSGGGDSLPLSFSLH